MDPFPQELIFALIFGAVMLVQFLLNLRRTKARRAKGEPVRRVPSRRSRNRNPIRSRSRRPER